MFDYFDYFLDSTTPIDATFPIHETKHGYEFEMFAFASSENEGYAIVTGADSGRLHDMAKIIADEFDAKIDGWLVLLSSQQRIGKTLLNKPTTLDMPNITHYENSVPAWIIKLTPNTTSLLFR